MGVLHSIPLCSRGSNNVAVEPLDLDKNNNSLNEAATSQVSTIVHQPSQPALPPPEATSTPRPQSPTGMVNSQYSENSSAASEPNEDTLPTDSGLEDTEFEYSKPDLLEDNFDDTLDVDVIDQDDDEDDIDDGHEEIDLNDPVERPPEPTVPDERVASSSSSSDEELALDNVNDVIETSAKEETNRKISSLLSELVGDHPHGEVTSNKIEVVR